MAVKLRTEYGSVLHMPTLKENMREKGGPATGDPYGHKQYSGNQGQFAHRGIVFLCFVIVCDLHFEDCVVNSSKIQKEIKISVFSFVGIFLATVHRR